MTTPESRMHLSNALSIHPSGSQECLILSFLLGVCSMKKGRIQSLSFSPCMARQPDHSKTQQNTAQQNSGVKRVYVLSTHEQVEKYQSLIPFPSTFPLSKRKWWYYMLLSVIIIINVLSSGPLPFLRFPASPPILHPRGQQKHIMYYLFVG